MKPARTDVKVTKESILCPNSTMIGFSSCTLHPGDLFMYQDGTQMRMGKSHGVVHTLEEPNRKMVFAQVLFNNLQFSGERWVDPGDVLETVPQAQVSLNLFRHFIELERNQE